MTGEPSAFTVHAEFVLFGRKLAPTSGVDALIPKAHSHGDRLPWAHEVPSSNLGAPTNSWFLFPIT